MGIVVRSAAAVALAMAVWIPSSVLGQPTTLEVAFHGDCHSVLAYIGCMAGGRENSPGSQFVTVERHRTFAGLTADDRRDIDTAGWNYICDQPTLCAS